MAQTSPLERVQRGSGERKARKTEGWRWGGEEKPGIIAQRRAGGASAARCPALLPEVTRNGCIRTDPPMSAGAQDEDGDDRSPIRAAAPRDTASPKANPAVPAGPQSQRRVRMRPRWRCGEELPWEWENGSQGWGRQGARAPSCGAPLLRAAPDPEFKPAVSTRPWHHPEPVLRPLKPLLRHTKLIRGHLLMSTAWGPPSAPGSSWRGWDGLISHLGAFRDSRAVARTKGQPSVPALALGSHGTDAPPSWQPLSAPDGITAPPGARAAPHCAAWEPWGHLAPVPLVPCRAQPRSSSGPETPFSCPWTAAWGSRQEKPPHGY